VVESVISATETTFLPGRNILEGVVILHETLHELRKRKRKGIIMKLDFEKLMIRYHSSFYLRFWRGKKFPTKWIEWVE
jgi:hypothetical protein